MKGYSHLWFTERGYRIVTIPKGFPLERLSQGGKLSSFSRGKSRTRCFSKPMEREERAMKCWIACERALVGSNLLVIQEVGRELQGNAFFEYSPKNGLSLKWDKYVTKYEKMA